MTKPTPNANKKRKPDEDISGKKRIRVSYSCSECHRRKQKCDRQMPCGHCIARKVSHLCQPYTPGKSERDVELRLSRLEQIVETALPQYCFGPNDQDDDSASQAEDNDTAGGLQSDGKWYGVSATGSVAPGELLQQIQNVTEPGPSQQMFPPNIPDRPEQSGPGMLQTLIHECGVKPTNINELMDELPSPRISDALIAYYFRDVNWTRYPISETDFRSAYVSLLTHRAEGLGTTNTNDICFLGLLFVVLAISCRVARDDIVEPTQRRVVSMRYYWASRRSVLIAAAIQPDTLWMVLTRLLSARFLTFDRRITECWSQLGAAVRTAQALGLHLDGSRLGIDPREVEYRRRIWSYLYHADRSYSLVLGRPTSIQDYYTSTQPPSNIDPDGPPLSMSLPLSTPTPTTFVILRHQLAVIIGKITHHFQHISVGGAYSEVVALDDDLLRFMTHLPHHFSLDPDTSLDMQYSYIPIHRFLLVTEILFVRTSLHRPYLLRRLKTDRYARSRAACYESALKDFEVRQAYRATHSPDSQRALGNAYREFQIAMVSGIYLVLEPEGRHATAMRTIMDIFIEDCQGVLDLDETTGRELKIIEFLKTKANMVQSSIPSSSGPDLDAQYKASKHESHAQLLLGLQQATPAQLFPTNVGLNGLEPTTSPILAHPYASGSPSSDEDLTAQFLLDNWCNSMNGGPQVNSHPAYSWDGATMPQEPQSSLPPQPMPTVLNDSVGADWNYWETLLSHIQPSS